MARIELATPQPRDVPELGRICFEAFKGISDRHAFPRDLPTQEVATRVIGMLTGRKDFYGVAARLDGRLAGSNFISCMDAVGGVGPITVDPAADGKGVGRALMKDVLEHAKRIGMTQVRLLQDSFNTKSLSLYASLGFAVRCPIGLMEVKPASAPDASVAPATEAMLPMMDELTRRYFKVSRRNEILWSLKAGWPVFARTRAGRMTGYMLPGFFGHGVAETEADALAMIGEAARVGPPESAMFLCPLTLGEFHRAAMAAGHRLRKVMTYMTTGPFEEPSGIWWPAIAY